MTLSDNTNQNIPIFGLTGDQRLLKGICSLLVLIGVLTFAVGVSGPQAHRIWQVYLINYLFWSGLGFGAVLFTAIINMTGARWARPLKHIAEAPGAFLPIAFLLFLVLYAGREEIFPWIRTPATGKEIWLNSFFLFVRNGAGLLLLTSVCMALMYYSVRDDVASAAHMLRTGQEPAAASADAARNWRIQSVLSPIVGIAYGLVLTLVGFDLVMSLDPHWYSTLFGGYFFIGSFYTSLAALVVLTVLVRKKPGAEKFLGDQQFHDLGKLLFAFCMVTGYLFFAQFLTIWYGNLPEETRYVILRVVTTPWEPVAWIVLTAIFTVPFVVLLSKKIKMKPGPMMALSILILTGMWLERFILVVPSLWKQQGIPLGLTELGITGGFLGVMALAIIIFFRRVPLFPLSGPRFLETHATAEEQAVADGE